MGDNRRPQKPAVQRPPLRLLTSRQMARRALFRWPLRRVPVGSVGITPDLRSRVPSAAIVLSPGWHFVRNGRLEVVAEEIDTGDWPVSTAPGADPLYWVRAICKVDDPRIAVFAGTVGEPWGIEAVFDAHGAASELLASYESLVLSRGWSIYEPELVPKGFTSGIAVAPSREFRMDNQGAILRIIVGGRQHMSADVRLRVDWETPRRRPGPSGGPPPSAERMPILRLPVGVPLSPDASGGAGEHRWYSYATAETATPVSALAEHLAGQLVEIGWTRIAGDSGEGATWSSWRLPGEGDWRGFLLVLEAFSPQERSLFLYIKSRESGDDHHSSNGLSRRSPG
jgi:hypothetical protein